MGVVINVKMFQLGAGEDEVQTGLFCEVTVPRDDQMPQIRVSFCKQVERFVFELVAAAQIQTA